MLMRHTLRAFAGWLTPLSGYWFASIGNDRLAF